MKPLTSWTRQVSAHDKCPKRFYLRYLEPSGISQRFNCLRSVRELGGHVVHAVLATVVRAVANGDRVGDHPYSGQRALEEFDRIVADSGSLPPWKLLHECQVAELHNGQLAQEEIAHWREIIPLCVENGLRVMQTLGFRSDAGERKMLAEQGFRFKTSERVHRGIIDVLLRDGKNWTVYDWKCHSISNTDVRQVHFYQDYLAKAEGVPHSRLHGFAVDLLREEIMPVHFRPHDHPTQIRHRVRLHVPEKSANPFGARATLENCSRCPFAAVCAESAVKPPHAIQILEELA